MMLVVAVRQQPTRASSRIVSSGMIESVKTQRNDPEYQSSVSTLGWIIHAGARASTIARTIDGSV